VPTLDVSEVFDDDDLMDSFTVLRRSECVGDDGRATFTRTAYPNTVGFVMVKGPGKNTRKDDSQMTSRDISVVTQFRLRAASDGVQPDEIVWDGVTFTITSITPHTRWGEGFVKAEATSMNASDRPPR
jgi:hypothetical protein